MLKTNGCGRITLAVTCMCLAMAVMCGCAGNRQTIIGDYTVVEKSRKEHPEWMGKEVCPAEKVCQKGSRTDAHNVEDGRTDAYQDAIKQYAMALDSMIKRLYEQGREEAADPDNYTRAFKEMVASANKIRVNNVKVEDFWWEKKRVVSGNDSVRYLYDYSILVSLPESWWKEQVRKAIDRAKEKARQEKQEALIKEMDKFGENVFTEMDQM